MPDSKGKLLGPYDFSGVSEVDDLFISEKILQLPMPQHLLD